MYQHGNALAHTACLTVNFLAANILKHFRNAPLYIYCFFQHGLVEYIFSVILYVRVP